MQIAYFETRKCQEQEWHFCNSLVFHGYSLLFTSFDSRLSLCVEPISTSIFEFWNQMKLMQSELYQLATVIMSIPPTQSTVERAFSALGLVLVQVTKFYKIFCWIDLTGTNSQQNKQNKIFIMAEVIHYVYGTRFLYGLIERPEVYILGFWLFV